MAYEPFQMPYRITGDEDLSTLARKINAIMEGLTFYVNQLQVYENGTGVPTNELVEANKDSWSAVATNFDTRNDRISTVPADPVIAADGTAIDHTINTDGSCDISVEWSFSGEGDDYNIDGFIVWLRSSDSSDSYVFGANPEEETDHYIGAEKRAIIFRGKAANRYYSIGIQAYRMVDQDVNANGILKSNIVQPALSAENPYQPTSNIAFAGNVIGTLNGTSVAAVVTNANNSVQQGTAYNSVTITTADGVKASHNDNSYSQMTGDGFYRNIAIPAETNFQGFETGSIPSDFAWASTDEGGGNVSVVSAEKHTGTYSLKVSEGKGSSETIVSASRYVPANSNIIFWIKPNLTNIVDDECTASFYIDGVEQMYIRSKDANGVSGWVQYTFPVAEGVHVFQWELDRDGLVGAAAGNRCFYVDDITFYSIGELEATRGYNYLMRAGEVTPYDATINSEKQGQAMKIPVQLPPEFRGKNFNVAVAWKDTAVSWGSSGLDGPWVHNFRCYVDGPIDYVNATFKVVCYVIYGMSAPETSELFLGNLAKFTYIAWV